MARTHWLDLFTVETWKEFQDQGGDVSGFSDKRWATVKKIKPGDYLLCYLTRISRWAGLLEAVGEPFFDEQPIWSSAVYPSRVGVRTILALPPEHGVPVLEMREELSVFRGPGQPEPVAGPVPRVAGQMEGSRRRGGHPGAGGHEGQPSRASPWPARQAQRQARCLARAF